MAVAKIARVVGTTAVGAETRLLDIELSDGPLGFSGGQYIIVNSGIALPGGKIAKRAYSILSSDAEQHRITLAVRRIGSGPGSNFMHRHEAGGEFEFSGPWGQYAAPAGLVRSQTLIIATDTGITAAVGLVCGERFRPCLSGCTLVWFVENDDYFVSAEFVKKRLPAGIKFIVIQTAPPIGNPDRKVAICNWVSEHLNGAPPDAAFLSGDGSVLVPLREQLFATGVPDTAVRMETFFNHVIRKAPV